MNNLTHEELTKRACALNNGPYEFISKTSTEMVLRCFEHGVFTKSSQSFYNKAGCPTCDYENKLRRAKEKFDSHAAKFVEKAKSIHGDKYDYSKSVYKGALEKLTITCPKHEDFEQTASSHLRGTGCPKCAFEASSLQADFRRDDAAYQERRRQALDTEPIYYVYQYNDPRDGKVVYVGMGKGDRMYQHLTKSHNAGMRNFVSKMTKLGVVLSPEVVKKDLLQAEAFDLERELIAKYKRRKEGGSLFNVTLGGEGIVAYNHTEESRRKIGEATKRVMQDPEYKAQWLEAHKAGCSTEEAKVNKSKATKRGWDNKETRRKRSEGIKAARSSEESRAKTRAQQLEQWTDEAKRKASEFAKSRLQDPLIKIRSSVANAYNWCKRQGRPFSEVKFN